LEIGLTGIQHVIDDRLVSLIDESKPRQNSGAFGIGQWRRGLFLLSPFTDGRTARELSHDRFPVCCDQVLDFWRDR
jgi:hypothetical protein